MRLRVYPLFPIFLLLPSLFAQNFPWERIQLTEEETANYPEIAFGDLKNPVLSTKECKAIPGDDDWPSDESWANFNETLGGALLKPKPMARVCYPGDDFDSVKCSMLKRLWSASGTHADDPISISTQWSEGHSCMPEPIANATCRQGGYPVYVVNATSVRHIQLAVNFARNQNIRLVIKNSGHEFSGKSTGGHSLSIWVHNLKQTSYLPNYSSPAYNGRALAVSAGTKSADTGRAANAANISVISPGGSSVGQIGGFMMAGGHSGFTSFYGLAADVVLEFNIVLADGRYVRASVDENEDLFWAVRGGGGGTWGVVTSTIYRVFTPLPSASSSITFTTVPNTGGTNTTVSREVFWAGIKIYWAFCTAIVRKGGLGYNFIRHTPIPNNSSNYGLTFTTSISVQNITRADYIEWVTPFFKELQDAGLPVSTPRLARRQDLEDDEPLPPTGTPYPGGNTVGNTRLASRFFQYANFETPEAVYQTADVIREFVEKGGYTFHGINYSPTVAVASRFGNPNNAVNPAFRDTVMHAEAFDSQTTNKPIEEQVFDHRRFQRYVQKWRDVTPGSGSYQNEGDGQEQDWVGAFYGKNWGRLVDAKKKVDPWGMFYAVSGVGSQEWEVRGSSGGGRDRVLTQDGRLCRV